MAPPKGEFSLHNHRYHLWFSC